MVVMLSKRVVACLDVKDGELAKSVKFVDTKTIGDPVEKAKEYYEQIIFNFADSIYFVEARKKYRALRGDYEETP